MNQASESMTSESRNPWKQRSALPKPAGGSAVLSAVLFFLASAAIPLALFDDVVAIVSWGLLTAGGYFFTRRSKGLTVLVVCASLLGAILPGVLLPLETLYYPAIGAIITAMCVGACAGAYFQTVTNRFWILPMLSLLAAGAAFAVTGAWLMAVMALALLPAMMLLSVATHKGEACTSAICYTVGGFLVTAVILVLLWIFDTYGSVSPDLLRSLLNEWKEGFVQTQIASRGELMAMLEERMAAEGLTEQAAANLETLKSSFMQVMSNDAIRASMDTLFQMLPAVLFLCCAIPAFLAQRLLNAAYVTGGMGAVVTPESEFFTMSLPSAVLYVVSLFLSMLSVDGMGFVSMVAGNLSLILLPGMLLIGMRYLKLQLAHGVGLSRKVLTAILVLMLCCATSGVLYLGAFYGAYMRIMQVVHRGIKKKMDQNNG